MPYIKVADMTLEENMTHIVTSSRFVNKADVSEAGIIPVGSTVFPKRGGAILTNKKRITSFPVCMDLNLMAVTPKNELLPDYVYYYFLNLDLRKINNGSSIPQINNYSIEPLTIPYPESLPEQQRIVSLLDEAFESIAGAKVNAEKNLVNARELLESVLDEVFSDSGEGFEVTTIGDQITLQRGFDITKNQQEKGRVPVVSSGGIKSYHNVSMAKAPGVVIGRKGTLGKAYYLSEDYWPHDTTLWVKDFRGNNPRLVYYLFLGLDVSKLDSGAANPALNRNIVHPIKIYWPKKEQQRAIVARLDALSAETKRLEGIYQRKVESLEELKKSVLQRAFEGGL